MLLCASLFSVANVDSLLNELRKEEDAFNKKTSEIILELRRRSTEIHSDSLRHNVNLQYALRLIYLAEAKAAQEELIGICSSESAPDYLKHMAYIYLSLLPGTEEKRKEYLEMAGRMSRNASDSADLWQAYGMVYKSSNRYASAEIEFLKAIELYTQLKMYNKLATTYNNLGTLYGMQGEIEKAEEAFSKCLDFAIEQDDKSLIMNSFINMGHVEDIKGNYRASNDYMRRAKAIAQEEGNVSYLQAIYEGISTYYVQMGKFDSAYAYAIKAHDIHDSLEDNHRLQGYMIAEERFKTADRKQRIAELELAESEQRRLLERKGNRLRFIVTIVVFLLVACALLFAYSLSLKKRNLVLKELAERNTELYLKKIDEIIKVSELKTVNAILEGQEIERKRIAADLHDRLGSMLSTVKLHFAEMEERLSKLENNNAQQLSSASTLLDEAVLEVRRISHNMATGVLAGFGLGAAIEDLAENLKRTRQVEVITDLHLGDNRMPHNIEITAYRIIQELITNILRHADATSITIQSVKHSDHLNIMVEDNGKGMDTSESEDGMGWRNIRERVAVFNGEIHIDTARGRGTIIDINLPLDPV
jgi:signal transduction histidine kinase/Flp pilus assembly protein TadD